MTRKLIAAFCTILSLALLFPSASPADTPPGSDIWKAEIGDCPFSPVMGDNGWIYAVTTDKRLWALNATSGVNFWSFGADSELKTPPTLGVDGTIYLGAGNGTLLALNGTNGQIFWQYQMDGAPSAAPSVGPNGTVYAGSGTTLYALNQNGTRAWTYSANMSQSSPSVGQNGLLYFGDSGGNVHALNATSGRLAWMVAPASRAIQSSPAIGPDGTVYLGSEDKYVYALNGATGVVKWSLNTHCAIYGSAVIGPYSRIYIGSGTTLYALDAATGKTIWSRYSEGAINATPVLGQSDMIYFGSYVTDSGLGAANCWQAGDGSKIWMATGIGSNPTSPVLDLNSQLYIGSGQGVHALKTGSNGPIYSVWPKLGLNKGNRGYNVPPTADAGSVQNVAGETTVILNGLNSLDADGFVTNYAWTQVSGTSVSLRDNASAEAGFASPIVGAGGETLVFRLLVTDNNLATDSQEVSVVVSDDGGPTADAGRDQTVRTGSSVTLDGSASSSPSAPISTYAWTQVSGPSVSLSAPGAAVTTFTAPLLEGTLDFYLTVTDLYGLKSTDMVNVNVSDTHTGPTADAGEDRSQNEGTTVQLSAEKSTADNASIVSYSWTQISGRTVTLDNADHVTSTFVLPCVGNRTQSPTCVSNGSKFVFDLQVTDSNGLKGMDRVTITDLENGINGVPAGSYSVNAATGNCTMGVACPLGSSLVALEAVNATGAPGSTPYGLLDFKVKVPVYGDTANVTVSLSEPAPADARWYKFENGTGWSDFSAHAVFNANRTEVTLELTDGGEGDADGLVNGYIEDPSGPVTGTDSSSSGCLMNPGAGLGLEWLLLALGPLLALGRRR